MHDFNDAILIVLGSHYLLSPLVFLARNTSHHTFCIESAFDNLHALLPLTLFCSVSLLDFTGQWIDTRVPSIYTVLYKRNHLESKRTC